MKREFYVICVNNEEYPVDLLKGMTYKAFEDEKTLQRDSYAIEDENGEIYLYRKQLFKEIQISKEIQQALAS